MRKGLKLPTILISLFLAGLLAYFIKAGNYEFLIYIVIAGLLYLAILLLDKKYKFPVISVWLFAIWIVGHMLGGAVYLGGTRLYDLMIIMLYNGGGEMMILKYDQVMHIYSFLVIGTIIYHILKNHFKKDQASAIIILTILATLGVSLLNEVVEFATVLFANGAEGVGGYYNTALDMVFNVVGATLGAFFYKGFLDKK